MLDVKTPLHERAGRRAARNADGAGCAVAGAYYLDVGAERDP